MKKVSDAKPPKKQPEPEGPQPTKAALLCAVWEHERSRRFDAINRFRDAIGPQAGPGSLNGSIAEAIEWKGYGAMCAEAFLRGEARFAERYIEPLREVAGLPDDPQVLADILKVLEEVEERITQELLGHPLSGTGGGTGPWHPNSTNPLANIHSEARCTAKRDTIKMVWTMRRLLLGE